jgi:hypothetical protein
MRMARKRGEDSENGVPNAKDSENSVLRIDMSRQR